MYRKPVTPFSSRPAAQTATAACVTAPVVAGQGGGTRNRAAWLSVADFLARQNLRAVLAARAAADGKRSADVAARAAGASALPDGNHGENK